MFKCEEQPTTLDPSIQPRIPCSEQYRVMRRISFLECGLCCRNTLREKFTFDQAPSSLFLIAAAWCWCGDQLPFSPYILSYENLGSALGEYGWNVTANSAPILVKGSRI